MIVGELAFKHVHSVERCLHGKDDNPTSGYSQTLSLTLFVAAFSELDTATHSAGTVTKTNTG